MSEVQAGRDFLVGCRVEGVIQHYSVNSLDYSQAQQTVRDGVRWANPILVVILGGKNA